MSLSSVVIKSPVELVSALQYPVEPDARRIGDILVDHSVLPEELVHEQLQRSRRNQLRLGDQLISEGLLSPTDLRRALALQQGLPVVAIEGFDTSQLLQSHRVFSLLAENHGVAPLVKAEQKLALAFPRQIDAEALNMLKLSTGNLPFPVLADDPVALSLTILACTPRRIASMILVGARSIIALDNYSCGRALIRALQISWDHGCRLIDVTSGPDLGRVHAHINGKCYPLFEAEVQDIFRLADLLISEGPNFQSKFREIPVRLRASVDLTVFGPMLQVGISE